MAPCAPWSKKQRLCKNAGPLTPSLDCPTPRCGRGAWKWSKERMYVALDARGIGEGRPQGTRSGQQQNQIGSGGKDSTRGPAGRLGPVRGRALPAGRGVCAGAPAARPGAPAPGGPRIPFEGGPEGPGPRRVRAASGILAQASHASHPAAGRAQPCWAHQWWLCPPSSPPPPPQGGGARRPAVGLP